MNSFESVFIIFIALCNIFQLLFCVSKLAHLILSGIGVRHEVYETDQQKVTTGIACCLGQARNQDVCATFCLIEPHCVGFSYNSSLSWGDDSCYICESYLSAASVDLTVYKSVSRVSTATKSGRYCIIILPIITNLELYLRKPLWWRYTVWRRGHIEKSPGKLVCSAIIS